MAEITRGRKTRCDSARKSKLWLGAVLISATLAGCGGDSDPAPAAATPPAARTTDSLTGVSSAPGTTTLSWMPPTTNDDGTPLTLTGYKVYWGLTEGHYPHSVTLQNPGLTRHVVEQLSADTWYFIATALSADGESPPSNVVRMQVR
jgi:hypothetical protein